MKSLVDVRAGLENWLRSLDLNVPADVVPLTGAVGFFRVDNRPDGNACDAKAAVDIKIYVARAEEASGLQQADQLQTDIPDQMEGQRGGPWLKLRCNSSAVTEEVHADARYVVVVFAVEIWI
jgi:hypothetical protein